MVGEGNTPRRGNGDRFRIFFGSGLQQIID